MTVEPTYEELKKRIQELENELFLYKTIVDFVPIAIFAKDVQNEYNYIIWNKELEKTFGTKSEQIIGINDYQLFDKKEEADYFRQSDISVMSGKEIVDISIEDLRTNDGVKIVHTRKIPIYDKNNQPLILLGCLEDITQKVKTEKALHESETSLSRQNALFNTLLENLQIGVFMVDAETGKPLLANETAKKLLGRGILPDATKQNLSEVYEAYKIGTNLPYPPDEMPILLGMCGKSVHIDDMLVKRPDGTETQLEIFGSPIIDKQGVNWASLVSFIDITERKLTEKLLREQTEEIQSQNEELLAGNEEYEQLNEELRQTNEQLISTKLLIEESNEKLLQLNADKDKFISILGHDLKSPFNSILGFLELLSKNIRFYDIGKIERQINIIHESAIHTYDLLNDLLLWSKSQSGQLTFEPKRIIFEDICLEIIENLKYSAVTKEISIQCFDKEKTILLADLNMVKTILRNLISNAIKFTNRTGKIIIYTEKNIEDVTITVSDNGVGIEKETILKLWDFTKPITSTGTSGEKGTGFGLLLCKEFVEKHSGQIWVESELGKGSDFKFTIPLCNA